MVITTQYFVSFPSERGNALVDATGCLRNPFSNNSFRVCASSQSHDTRGHREFSQLIVFTCAAKLCSFEMCEKRARKIKKGSQLSRLREARRNERLQRMASPSSSDDSTQSPCPQQVDKIAQNRVILELAWKTVYLMHKNRLIQQKIIALQKETSEYVANILKNPEYRRRYLEHVQLYGVPQRLQIHIDQENRPPLNIKVEPTA